MSIRLCKLEFDYLSIRGYQLPIASTSITIYETFPFSVNVLVLVVESFGGSDGYTSPRLKESRWIQLARCHALKPYYPKLRQ